jgi:hypothetical protein
MQNPWLATPDAPRAVRELVRASWARSERADLDPERLSPPIEFSDDELRDYRLVHPLAGVLPVVRKLLVRDIEDDSGLVVAVGDARGRLLWVDGDAGLRRRAEGMLFVEGAGWSEADVGTSAPGTALALDHGIQIHAAEHFNTIVHPWSCTAVPVHDPETRGILGVIDITGGLDAVAPHTLALMEATATAMESELLVQRLRSRGTRRPSPRGPSPSTRHTLAVLGRDGGLLSDASGAPTTALSARHTEILTLLAWNRDGLSAADLARLVYGDPDAIVTLRAELVRLRRALARVAPALVPESRPYRLRERLDVDASGVLSLLDRGAHRAALAAYAGPVIPASTSPGIEQIRREVATRLRASLLDDASIDVLLDFARRDDRSDDVELWAACLRLLPPRSPKRAGVVAHLESIEAELR